MPTPGPRTQSGPLPGYTNPGRELPLRINRFMALRRLPVAKMGETPGLMYFNRNTHILGAGQIRRLWRQAINYIAAPPPYSWTASAPRPDQPVGSPPPFQITRALRYMTRSVYAGSGIDNTHFEGLHTAITPRVRAKPVTLGAGLARTRPTVRNRMTSFGSRVPTLNSRVPAAESEQP